MPLIRFITLLIICITQTVFASQLNRDTSTFETIFKHWTNAFNHRELAPACALFAKNITADYQGQPQKNYASICAGFKKIFNESDKRYTYYYKLHRIYHRDQLAVARITWYLTVTKNGKVIEKTQDEGIDVFQKTKGGQWQIVEYLSYPIMN